MYNLHNNPKCVTGIFITHSADITNLSCIIKYAKLLQIYVGKVGRFYVVRSTICHENRKREVRLQRSCSCCIHAFTARFYRNWKHHTVLITVLPFEIYTSKLCHMKYCDFFILKRVCVGCAVSFDDKPLLNNFAIGFIR